MTAKYKAFWAPGKRNPEWSTPPCNSPLDAARFLFQSFGQAQECRTERCNDLGECHGFNIQWHKRFYVMEAGQ